MRVLILSPIKPTYIHKPKSLAGCMPLCTFGHARVRNAYDTHVPVPLHAEAVIVYACDNFGHMVARKAEPAPVLG